VSSIKWGVTAGIIAALVSIGLGVLFGVNTVHIISRAVIFLLVFFALGAGLRVLINNYFPELMYLDEGSDSKITFDQPGSQINITLGGIGEYAVPEMYRNSGDPEELGNIEDLISGAFRARSSFEQNTADTPSFAPEQSSEGIDRKGEEDYNIQRDSFSAEPQVFESFREPEPSKPVTFEKPEPVFTPVFSSDSDDFEALPDLGSMATAFSTGFVNEEVTAMPHLGDEAEHEQMHYNKGNKPEPLKGDFNPKELAEGLRTVLKKDDM
jgi:hypothetical protein